MSNLTRSLKLSLANCGIREEPADFIAKCIKKGWVKPAKPEITPDQVRTLKPEASNG